MKKLHFYNIYLILLLFVSPRVNAQVNHHRNLLTENYNMKLLSDIYSGENVYFERRKKLTDLVIGELIDGRGKYLNSIVNGIWALCEETSWCLPAHIYGQKIGSTPLPEYNENVGDPYSLIVRYDPGQLSVEVEKITIIDCRLKYAWGDHLFRIKLVLRSRSLKGRIKYAFQPV